MISDVIFRRVNVMSIIHGKIMEKIILLVIPEFLLNECKPQLAG
jgi:hypothetical protein